MVDWGVTWTPSESESRTSIHSRVKWLASTSSMVPTWDTHPGLSMSTPAPGTPWCRLPGSAVRVMSWAASVVMLATFLGMDTPFGGTKGLSL